MYTPARNKYGVSAAPQGAPQIGVVQMLTLSGIRALKGFVLPVCDDPLIVKLASAIRAQAEFAYTAEQQVAMAALTAKVVELEGLVALVRSPQNLGLALVGKSAADMAMILTTAMSSPQDLAVASAALADMENAAALAGLAAFGHVRTTGYTGTVTSIRDAGVWGHLGWGLAVAQHSAVNWTVYRFDGSTATPLWDSTGVPHRVRSKSSAKFPMAWEHESPGKGRDSFELAVRQDLPMHRGGDDGVELLDVDPVAWVARWVPVPEPAPAVEPVAAASTSAAPNAADRKAANDAARQAKALAKAAKAARPMQLG